MRGKALPVAMILAVVFLASVGTATTTTPTWMPQIQRTTLDNGLTILTSNTERNGFVSLGILVRAGSAADPAGKAGLAHLVANAILNGPRQANPTDFAADLARICADAKVEVTRDGTFFLFELPATQIDDLLALIEPALTQPKLDATTLESIRSRTVAMLRERATEPTYVMIRNLYDLVFANHPYATAVLGTEASLNNITTGDLRTFHQRYYGANNTTIAIVGDLRKVDAARTIRAHFGTWKKTGTQATQITIPETQTGLKIRLVNRTGANISYICMARPVGSIGSDDYIAAMTLADVLGGGPFGRLNRNVVNTIKGCYRTAATVDPGAVSILRIGAMCHTKETQAVIDRITQTLDEVATGRIADRDLQIARAHLLNRMMATLTNPATLTRTLLTWQACGVDPTQPQNIVQKIERINTTALASAAKDLLDRDRFALLVIGDRRMVAEDLRRLADVEVVEFTGEIPVPAMRTVLKKIGQ